MWPAGRSSRRVSMRPASATLDQLELVAGGIDVGDADGEMAEGGAERIGLLLVPVMGKLDDRAARLVAIADEGECVAPLRHLALAQHLHAEKARIEIERLLQVEDAQHRMQHARLADAAVAGVLCGCIGIHQLPPFVPVMPPSGRTSAWR